MSIKGALMMRTWARWPTDWETMYGENPKTRAPPRRRRRGRPAAEGHVGEGGAQHGCRGWPGRCRRTPPRISPSTGDAKKLGRSTEVFHMRLTPLGKLT